jgi:hypothetical protein
MDLRKDESPTDCSATRPRQEILENLCCRSNSTSPSWTIGQSSRCWLAFRSTTDVPFSTSLSGSELMLAREEGRDMLRQRLQLYRVHHITVEPAAETATTTDEVGERDVQALCPSSDGFWTKHGGGNTESEAIHCSLFHAHGAIVLPVDFSTPIRQDLRLIGTDGFNPSRVFLSMSMSQNFVWDQCTFFERVVVGELFPAQGLRAHGDGS